MASILAMFRRRAEVKKVSPLSINYKLEYDEMHSNFYRQIRYKYADTTSDKLFLQFKNCNPKLNLLLTEHILRLRRLKYGMMIQIKNRYSDPYIRDNERRRISSDFRDNLQNYRTIFI